MKDFKVILIILLSVMLIATWIFFITDESRTPESSTKAWNTDSNEIRRTVMQALKDSLQKINNSVKPDTIFILKDSVPAKKVSLRQSPNDEDYGYVSEDMPVKAIKKIKSATLKVPLYFTVSGINFSAVTMISNKPGVTADAKEAEKLVLSFDLQNSDLPGSINSIYIILTGPDHRVIGTGLRAMNIFPVENDGWRHYSRKIQFTYTRKKRKTITAIFRPESFLTGTYAVKIYHNGKMIGASSTTLR
ncbi:MAG: hypothetical protein B6D37_10785 [Sphingobacteriales bacterium UTBCD1]|jgi:hypothetical protein|nr:MAG: hypothetical protein B6D37_10785 [Sphingobacteriales bacterium UTBCD1]